MLLEVKTWYLAFKVIPLLVALSLEPLFMVVLYF